jgi:hypothetical protein
MLNASDALRAHTRCKARLAELLARKGSHANDHNEFSPQQECILVRFIRENDGATDLEPELGMVRSAHATVHCVVIGLVQKRALGECIAMDREFAANSNFGAASSSLVTAIWNLEKKLHSMAG